MMPAAKRTSGTMYGASPSYSPCMPGTIKRGSDACDGLAMVPSPFAS